MRQHSDCVGTMSPLRSRHGPCQLSIQSQSQSQSHFRCKQLLGRRVGNAPRSNDEGWMSFPIIFSWVSVLVAVPVETARPRAIRMTNERCPALIRVVSVEEKPTWTRVVGMRVEIGVG